MSISLHGPEGLLLLTQIVVRTLEAADRGELDPPPAGVVGTRDEFIATLGELAEEAAVGVRLLLDRADLFDHDRAALQQWLDTYIEERKETP